MGEHQAAVDLERHRCRTAGAGLDSLEVDQAAAGPVEVEAERFARRLDLGKNG